MPTAAIWAYLERLPARTAEAELMTVEATLMPHLKERDRVKTLRRLENQIRREDEPAVTRDQYRASLAMMGIGYRNQGKKETSRQGKK